VEFNSTVKLSQQYAVLGKVYEKSGDKTLAQLAEGYYTMKEEAKGLSKLVEKQLQEYDLEILENSAILTDPYLTYIPCITGCLGAVAACYACCATT